MLASPHKSSFFLKKRGEEVRGEERGERWVKERPFKTQLHICTININRER